MSALVQKKTVATPSAEYSAAAANWMLPRTLMGGTRAMRAASTRYLPQEPGESDPSYASRLARTTLFNAYRKTVKDMTGKVFAAPIALGEDVPAKIKTYAENIDQSGRNLNVFAFDVFMDALSAPGVSFILAEMPPAIENGTRADEIASGTRPYLVHIKAEDLIGWKSTLIAGQETLTQVRIRECIEEPSADNPYEDKEVSQIRVLERGKWAIWRQVPDKPEDWFLFNEGTTTLQDIPLAAVYLKRAGFLTGEPPLEDLADLNVAHWQSQSDQRNILHVARVPILFGAGFDTTAKIVVGAGTMARSTDPAAKLSYVEHSGAAIGSGRDDLKDLELQMQVMGLQLLMPTPSQTATGEIRDDVKENSQLAMMAKALENAIEKALGFMAEYDGMGKAAGGSVIVNTDFGISAGDIADLASLIESRKNHFIRAETFLKEMKRRGVLSDDLVIETEAKDAAAEAVEHLTNEAAASGKTFGEPKLPLLGDPKSEGSQTAAPTEPQQPGLPAVVPPVAPMTTDWMEIKGTLLTEIRAAVSLMQPAPPPVINVQVDAPVINMPAQDPPVVNVHVDAPVMTVESPTINVEQTAPAEGPSVTEVLETDPAGNIKKFKKTPVAAVKAE